MKKEKFFYFGKKFSASIVAATIVFSTATALPSFAAKETTEVFAKGCVPDSAKTIEEHLEDEQETFDLDFIESSDDKTNDTLVDVCKAAMVSSYPSKVDLSNEFPKPDSQGTQGSCTAWAVGYALKSHQEYKEHGWSLSDKKHIFSPAYIYNQLNGGENKGTAISDALDLIANEGVCPLATMGYNQFDYKTQPNKSQKDMASNYKSNSKNKWNTVTGVNAVKAKLNDGNGVVLCISCPPDMDNKDSNSKNGVFDYIPSYYINNWNSMGVSYHAICVVGYDDNHLDTNGKVVPSFKYINSWGSYWGSAWNGNGFGYISYEMFENSYGANNTGYVLNDGTADGHKDSNEFFTSKTNYVKTTGDVRAYKSPDYFDASANEDNYEYTILNGAIVKISDFVDCSKGQQPYFKTEDGYYINAQKSSLTDAGMSSGEVIINGDKNNSVYNYNNSESSRITITPNSNVKFNNHNTLKIDYNVNQNDSYNGYAGAKVNLDKNVSINNAKEISFNYMTPENQNGTIALCLQGSVSKKIIELPTTNGEWKTFSGEYNFNNSNISDVEIYINGNESNCKTTPANGSIYLAEVSVGSNNVNIPSYQFNVSGDDNCTIEGTQSGNYKSAAYISVTANVKDGYKFIGWSEYKGGAIISTDPTYKFGINKNTNLYANVTEQKFYNFKLVNNSEGGVVGGKEGTYEEGEVINVNASTKLGYQFKGWSKTENGEIISTSIYYSFKIYEDTTLYANFIKLDTRHVSVSYNTSRGSVIVTGGGIPPTGINSSGLDIPTGSEITLVAMPSKGCSIVGWYDNAEFKGEPLSTKGSYSLTVENDTDLYIKFSRNNTVDYKLKVECDEGGKIGGSTTGEYEDDSYIFVAAYADDGYEFAGWSEYKGGPIIYDRYTYDFRISKDTTLYANFKKIPEYTVKLVKTTGCSKVEISTAGSKGLITVKENTTIDIFAYGQSGYTFKGWYDNASFSGSPISKSYHYTFSVNSNLTLYPKFEKDEVEQKYTVKFISEEGGNVQGDSVRTYSAGQSGVATANANDGYEFTGWSTEKDGPIISTYINYSYVVNSDMTIYLHFKKIPEYTVDLVKTTGCSSVKISTAYGASSITVREDTTIDVFAYGESDYTFKGWYDNASFNGSPISTSSHYTFQVKSNLTLYPKFENTSSTDSNILVKGVSNSVSDWTNANSGSYLNITSGSSDYLFNGAKTLKLDYNINTNDQYGGYAGRTISLESTYKNDSSKGYNGIGFWYMTPADFNGQIALCLQSQSAGLDDLVQLPSTNGEWKYYFYQTDKTNLSDLTLYINGSKNGYTTTSSNGIAKGTLCMANIEVNKK